MDRLQETNYKTRIGAAVILTACFALLAWLVIGGRTMETDLAAMQWFYSLRNPVTEGVLIPITHLGSKYAIVPVILVLVLIPKTRKPVGLPALLTGTAGLLLYSVLKPTFGRIRPDELMWIVQEHGFSFPSGHSMNSMICYGIIAFLSWRALSAAGHERAGRWTAGLLGLLIVLIGFSRPFVGVHYPTDVLGGFCIGGAVLLCATVLWDKVFSAPSPKQEKNP